MCNLDRELGMLSATYDGNVVPTDVRLKLEELLGEVDDAVLNLDGDTRGWWVYATDDHRNLGETVLATAATAAAFIADHLAPVTPADDWW
jgi:hypothetical protein